MGHGVCSVAGEPYVQKVRGLARGEQDAASSMQAHDIWRRGYHARADVRSVPHGNEISARFPQCRENLSRRMKFFTLWKPRRMTPRCVSPAHMNEL